MYHFITQGYACTALLLFFLYCFHAPLRSYYFNLAKTANVLIWLFCFFMLLHILYMQLIANTIFRGLLFPILYLDYSFLTLLIICIALLFKKARKLSVWLLLPIAWLLNPGIITGNFPDDDAYTSTWLKELSTWQRFLLFGLFFFLLTILIQNIANRAREGMVKEDNRLPDRI